MICGLHHIAILASNREQSLRFYCQGLGFALIRERVRPERGDEILWLEGYGVTLEVFVCENRPARPSNPEAYGLRHLALHVCKIENLRSALLAQGTRPEEIRTDSFDGKRMMFVKDPDGLPIELHE